MESTSKTSCSSSSFWSPYFDDPGRKEGSQVKTKQNTNKKCEAAALTLTTVTFGWSSSGQIYRGQWEGSHKSEIKVTRKCMFWSLQDISGAFLMGSNPMPYRSSFACAAKSAILTSSGATLAERSALCWASWSSRSSSRSAVFVPAVLRLLSLRCFKETRGPIPCPSFQPMDCKSFVPVWFKRRRRRKAVGHTKNMFEGTRRRPNRLIPVRL